MGLDIVPMVAVDEARVSFSYGGFAEFRKQLAAAIGIDLDTMEGFGGTNPWPTPEAEPLVHLLHHSDCDGELHWHQCDEMKSRLRHVVEMAWPDSARVPDYIYRAKGLELADLVDSVASDEFRKLEFC